MRRDLTSSMIIFFGIVTVYSFCHLTLFKENVYFSADSGIATRKISSSLPPFFLKSIGGEFKGVLASYLTLEAAAQSGLNKFRSEDEWDYITNVFHQSQVLDPYFSQTYFYFL